jgi:hypothetical protein
VAEQDGLDAQILVVLLTEAEHLEGSDEGEVKKRQGHRRSVVARGCFMKVRVNAPGWHLRHLQVQESPTWVGTPTSWLTSVSVSAYRHHGTPGPRSAMVIQFHFEDGKIVEVWESPDDIDAFTDFRRFDGVWPRPGGGSWTGPTIQSGVNMSDLASLLSDTQDGVETAQRVLSEVEHGLEVVEKVQAVAKHTRPVLRSASVVILGCLVGLGIVLLISRRRHASDIEIPEGESSEGVPDSAEDGRGSSAWGDTHASFEDGDISGGRG